MGKRGSNLTPDMFERCDPNERPFQRSLGDAMREHERAMGMDGASRQVFGATFSMISGLLD